MILGGGALYPVELFEYDRITPIPGDIVTLNIGNQKDTIDLEVSQNFERPWPEREIFWPKSYVEDDDFVAYPTSVEAPDIWADPKIYRAFFMSDRLAKALIRVRMH